MKVKDNCSMIQEEKEWIAYNMLKQFTEECRPDLQEYRFDDGFWVFAESKESADVKHNEWLKKKKR